MSVIFMVGGLALRPSSVPLAEARPTAWGGELRISWASTDVGGDFCDDWMLSGETGSGTSSIGPGRIDSWDSLGVPSSASEAGAIDEALSVAPTVELAEA